MKRKSFGNENGIKFQKKTPIDDDIQRERRNLPIYSMKEKLIDEFKNNKTIVTKKYLKFRLLSVKQVVEKQLKFHNTFMNLVF